MGARGPCADFQFDFKYQPIASAKRAESNYLADEKGPHHLGQVVVWVNHLYFYIYLTSKGMELPTDIAAFYTIFNVCESAANWS